MSSLSVPYGNWTTMNLNTHLHSLLYGVRSYVSVEETRRMKSRATCSETETRFTTPSVQTANLLVVGRRTQPSSANTTDLVLLWQGFNRAKPVLNVKLQSAGLIGGERSAQSASKPNRVEPSHESARRKETFY